MSWCLWLVPVRPALFSLTTWKPTVVCNNIERLPGVETGPATFKTLQMADSLSVSLLMSSLNPLLLHILLLLAF